MQLLAILCATPAYVLHGGTTPATSRHAAVALRIAFGARQVRLELAEAAEELRAQPPRPLPRDMQIRREALVPQPVDDAVAQLLGAVAVSSAHGVDDFAVEPRREPRS